jgi:hypothetical protein
LLVAAGERPDRSGKAGGLDAQSLEVFLIPGRFLVRVDEAERTEERADQILQGGQGHVKPDGLIENEPVTFTIFAYQHQAAPNAFGRRMFRPKRLTPKHDLPGPSLHVGSKQVQEKLTASGPHQAADAEMSRLLALALEGRLTDDLTEIPENKTE